MFQHFYFQDLIYSSKPIPRFKLIKDVTFEKKIVNASPQCSQRNNKDSTQEDQKSGCNKCNYLNFQEDQYFNFVIQKQPPGVFRKERYSEKFRKTPVLEPLF